MSFRPTKPRAYATTKEVVTRLYDQIRGGVKEVAHLLGHRGITQAYAYSDPAEDAEISFDQVRRLVAATRASAPVEDLAALAGGTFLPIAPLDDHGIALLSARSAQEHGEFMARLLQALGDGRICKLERPLVLKELDDVIRASVCLRARIVSEGEGPG